MTGTLSSSTSSVPHAARGQGKEKKSIANSSQEIYIANSRQEKSIASTQEKSIANIRWKDHCQQQAGKHSFDSET